jgi:hypothetical protein
MKIIRVARIWDGNSFSLSDTNNSSGEVMYSCLYDSRIVLSSLCVIQHRASCRWKGVQLKPRVAFFTLELVLFTIHHIRVAPYLQFTIHLSPTIYHSPYTCCAPSTIHHTLVVPHRLFNIHQLLQLPFAIHLSNATYPSQYTDSVLCSGDTVTMITTMSHWANTVIKIMMHTMCTADPQLHWSCSTLVERSSRDI